MLDVRKLLVEDGVFAVILFEYDGIARSTKYPTHLPKLIPRPRVFPLTSTSQMLSFAFSF